jgi:hypothetical protein
MKPKFVLTIIAFNTLFLIGSIATASSVNAEDNVPQFSQIISKLVSLDLKYHSLVTSAIDRAIVNKKNIAGAKEEGLKPIIIPVLHITAGMIPVAREQPQSDPKPSNQ